MDAVIGAERRIRGRGTEEAAWLAWPGWQRLPRAALEDLLPLGHRLVVVAPHPDDEVLGAGGVLTMAAEAGYSILVVAVSDGGASHPGSTRWPPELLVEQRITERGNALHVLGIDASQVLALHLPDGELGMHVRQLTARLTGALRGTDVVISPWQWDGHPDHEAVAAATMAAAAASGSTVLQVPIWGWHWVDPQAGTFPEDRAVRFDLPAAALQRKRSAVRCFLSQLTEDSSTGEGPILPEWVLGRLLRDREVLFR